MDPLSILDVGPDASPEELAAAYRRLAKRWHPDRARDHGAALRMAEINAAYDTLRSAQRRARAATAPAAVRRQAEATADATRAAAGGWLAEPVRRALGGELLAALEPHEAVVLVTPASTWSSPQALLALTDRRLLWLLDDAISQRVRSLRFDAIAHVEHRLRRPLRRAAVLSLRTRDGRRISFAELRPATAALIATRVRGW